MHQPPPPLFAATLLRRIVTIHPHETRPVLYSFGSLFSILASYFLLLPLREDAGISLGTATLPKLFVGSLAATLVVTPAVSSFLNRRGGQHARGRDAALRHIYTAMAGVLLLFYVLYNISTVELVLQRVGLHTPPQHHRHGQHQAFGHQASSPPAAAAAATALDAAHRQQQHGTGGAANSTASAATKAAASWNAHAGDPSLSSAQRALRAAFYITINVLNLCSISSLWAVCADAFTAEAASRLFGFISAGATLGQLGGSMAAMLTSWAAGSMGSSTSAAGAAGAAAVGAPASSLFLLAAALQLLAAQLVCRIRPGAGGGLHAQLNKSSSGSKRLSNSSSSGNVAAAGGAQQQQQQQPAFVDAEEPGSFLRRRSLEGHALLPTSLSLRAEGAMPAMVVAGGGGGVGGGSSSSVGSLNGLLGRDAGGGGGDGGSGSRPTPGTGTPPQQQQQQAQPAAAMQVSGLTEGFRLIFRSPYLMLLCGNLLLTYMVGSTLYFQRAMVVSAAVRGPAFRTRFFAALNSFSASAILLTQLFATSSLLRALGMPAALGLAPLICLAALAAIALAPSPTTVAVSEVARKVFGYAVLRPAREVLFTVVPRRDKYSAKLCIDTVVQRLGDSIAAALFQALDVKYSFGQAGIGAAGCCMCCVWLFVALLLGRKHVQLAVGHASAEAGGGSAAAEKQLL